MNKNRMCIPEGCRYRNEGIRIVYYTDTKNFRIEAWHDGNFATGEGSVSLRDFLTTLGISKEDCIEALGGLNGEVNE